MNNYIKIARPDHWIKNLTVLGGALFAWAIAKPQDTSHWIFSVVLALISSFLVASSNYTINELVDAKEDKQHPDRYSRPVPSGKIVPFWGYAQWFLLALAGLALAWAENRAFFLTAFFFFVMGLIYNIKPFRTKDIVYLDVLSESINSPVRFLLGWFAMKCYAWPPVSLILSFWMLAAFFMSIKRMAELRSIDNPEIAAAYRKPFKYYNQDRLISCAVFYAAAFGIFTGIFTVDYRPELILALPLIGGFLAAYMHEGFNKNSITLYPEKMYKQAFLTWYLIFTMIIIVFCLLVKLPWIKL